MASYARLAIAAWRNEPCVRLLRFRGIDLTDIELRGQIRLAPDTPGEPRIALNTVTAPGDEGLRLLDVSTIDGVVTSNVQLNLSRVTMSDGSKLPYSGEIGDSSTLSYAIQVGGQTRLAGEFIALATVMDSDNAPSDRPESYSGNRTASPWSTASVDLSIPDAVNVTIDGAELISPLADRAETAADRAEAARDALEELITPPFDAVAIYSNSMATSGASAPQFNSFGRVAEVFALPVYGMAVPGAPSTHVAGLAVGTTLTLAGNRLSTGANAVTATNFQPIVHSQAFGAFFGTGQILSSPADADTRQLAGRLGTARVILKRERTGGQEIYTVTPAAQQPAGVALPLVVPPGTSFVPDDVSPGKRALRILMALDNDFYDFDAATAAVAAFVDRFGADNCIVFSVQAGTTAAPSEFGDTGDGTSGSNFVNMSKVSAWIEKHYPGVLVDSVAEQIAHGLDDSGQVLTGPAREQYDADVAHVIVPAALRADDRHPNNGGHLSRPKRAYANAARRGMVP